MAASNGQSEAGDANGDVPIEILEETPSERRFDVPTVGLLREFSDPTEWRTMARVRGDIVFVASIIDAKASITGSRFRRDFVRNLFLMSRSDDGWGSRQMVEVATRSPSERASGIRRFFGMGPKTSGGNGGAQP
jgi:hypothetical protein